LRLVQDPAPATSQTAQNTGQRRANGLELETAWELTDALRLSAHTAVQRSKDLDTGEDPGNAPGRQAYLRFDWRFAPKWSLDSQVKWISKRERAAGDLRSALDGYTLTDLTLLRRASSEHSWEFALSLRNAFDEQASEPTPAPGLVPDDLPLAGRAVRFEVRRRF
jgi:outer membrane receptor protein involved in Fe transport